MATTITFAINGQRYDVSPGDYDLTTTLNTFIRRHTPYKGTKLACGEGGCGACVVDLSRRLDLNELPSAGAGEIVHVSVNSCLRLLASMDGWSVTTTEGLRGPKGEFHPIQERIAEFNGSQCGFCTPGMVMTLYSSLREQPNRTMADIESRFDGNICRCTGFRPIFDAAKSFATDADVNNLVNRLPFTAGPYSASVHDPKFPEFLNSTTTTPPRRIQFSDFLGRTYIRPSNLADLLASAFTSTSTYGADSVKFLNANTSVGYTKKVESDKIKVYLDITSVPELHRISMDDSTGLVIGGANTVTAFIRALKKAAAEHPEKTRSFEALAKHAWRVAGVHVRNVGSVVGNLVIAKRFGFVSDLATILLGANATVTWMVVKGSGDESKIVTETESLEEFLKTPDMRNGVAVVSSITVPWTGARTYFKTFKAAPRPQQSLAIVNAAFQLEVNRDSGVVEGEARVVFGGIMPVDHAGSHPIRASRCEAALKGKSIRYQSTLEQAIAGFKQDFEASAGKEDNSPEGKHERRYKERVAAGFLYKFLVEVLKAEGGGEEMKLSDRVRTVSEDPADREVQRSTQKFEIVEAEAKEKGSMPVGRAIPHVAAKLQAAGEAVYTDDVEAVKGTLYGAYVMSSRANGKLLGFDTTDALAYQGVRGVYSAKDVPGRNSSWVMPGTPVPVFAEIGSPVEWVGQVIAIVVAENELAAREGARLVKVQYEDAKEGSVVTSIEQALAEGGSRIYPDALKGHVKAGDAEGKLKAFTDSAEPSETSKYVHAKGQVKIGTQHHFYMEPQAVYVVPDEDMTFNVYVPIQWPDGMSMAVSQVLGIPLTHVRTIVRRAGGAFGGKASHPMYIGCAAAVASYQTGKPVRVTLSRIEDFTICGGREETLGNYEVIADKATGRIEALTLEGWLQSGWRTDFNTFTLSAYAKSVNEAYNIPNITATVRLVKTDLAPRTATRGPGETQACYTMETIIEHVAHLTGLNSDVVREANFYEPVSPTSPSTVERIVSLVLPVHQHKNPDGSELKNYSIPALWNRAKEMSEYKALESQVEAFNSANRWKKQGLTLTPMRYHVAVLPKSAVVNIYGDGSVVVNHGGVEMGQGMNTKAAQVVAYELAKVFGDAHGEGDTIMGHIKFGDTNSEVIPNAIFTGGSTGSEGVAEACRIGCSGLVERLKPVLEGLRKKKGEAGTSTGSGDVVSWAELCGAAKAQGVKLSTASHFDGGLPVEKRSAFGGFGYDNFGVAAIHVQVDVITGEVTLLSVNLVYDCGRSLNPAIDIGQCEGAFLMGVGHWIREHVEYGADGKHLSASTFKYHPPCVKDLPQKWNVEFLQNVRFDKGILSSKASGEPPLVLATGVAIAVRKAIDSARKDAGVNGGWWQMDAPLTPESIAEYAGTDISQFKI